MQTIIILDSAVDCYCDYCGRFGRRGYLVDDSEVGSVELVCPVCAEAFIDLNALRPGEGWYKDDTDWR